MAKQLPEAAYIEYEPFPLVYCTTLVSSNGPEPPLDKLESPSRSCQKAISSYQGGLSRFMC